MEGQTMRIVSNRRSWVVTGITAAAILAVTALLGIRVLSGPDDGIEYGKVYGLAKSFPVDMEMDNGRTIPSRQFDFSDRNLPVPSIVIPNKDPRDVPIVIWDDSLTFMKTKDGKPMGVVKKVWVEVPARTFEGEYYPTYEYPQWRYRMAYVDEPIHTPRVTPRR